MHLDVAAVYKLAGSDDALGRLVKEAIEVTERALDEQGCVSHVACGVRLSRGRLRSEEHVALSFNGGKDCKFSGLCALSAS